MMSRRRASPWSPILVSLAIGTLSFALTVYIYRQREKKSRVSLLRPTNVPPKVWSAFQDAARRVERLSTLHNGDKLILYGLYKQACCGVAPEHVKFDTLNVMVAKAKHDAWRRMRGLSQEEAAIHYIQAVDELEKEDPSSSLKKESQMLAPAVSLPVNEDNDESHLPPNVARLFELAQSINASELRQFIEESKVDVNQRDELGQSALHLAVDRGNLDCVNVLIECGCSVNSADEDGISVLQTALDAGHVDVCALLLKKGADPDQSDNDGNTPRSSVEGESDEMKALFK